MCISAEKIYCPITCFTRRGVTNLYKKHVDVEENLHVTKVTHYQYKFKTCLWIGITDNFIIGPVVLSYRLNGEIYLEHFQNKLPHLLEDLPFGLCQEMWFQHDGAPLHFSTKHRVQFIFHRRDALMFVSILNICCKSFCCIKFTY